MYLIFCFLIYSWLSCSNHKIRIMRKPSLLINKTRRKELDSRDRLFRFYCQNSSPASWDIYKAQGNCVVWLHRKAEIDYFQQLLLSHPSALWYTLSIAACSSVSMDNWSSFASDHNSIANSPNKHFASVSSNDLTHTMSVPTFSSSTNSPPTSVLSLVKTTPIWCEQGLFNLNPRCATGLD